MSYKEGGPYCLLVPFLLKFTLGTLQEAPCMTFSTSSDVLKFILSFFQVILNETKFFTEILYAFYTVRMYNIIIVTTGMYVAMSPWNSNKLNDFEVLGLRIYTIILIRLINILHYPHWTCIWKKWGSRIIGTVQAQCLNLILLYRNFVLRTYVHCILQQTKVNNILLRVGFVFCINLSLGDCLDVF